MKKEVGREKFAVSINSWAVYVKAWDFFVSQGGLTEKWGKTWVPIWARSIADARRIGEAREERRTGRKVPGAA